MSTTPQSQTAGRDTPKAGEIGVSGQPDYPTEYLHQLVEPFRRRA